MEPPDANAISVMGGVLGWYGFGRFFLEPLRENSTIVFGKVRINQAIGGVLAAGACLTLLARAWF